MSVVIENGAVVALLGQQNLVVIAHKELAAAVWIWCESEVTDAIAWASQRRWRHIQVAMCLIARQAIPSFFIEPVVCVAACWVRETVFAGNKVATRCWSPDGLLAVNAVAQNRVQLTMRIVDRGAALLIKTEP